jgi:hypothetical protein
VSWRYFIPFATPLTWSKINSKDIRSISSKSYHGELVFWVIPHVVHALVRDEEGDQGRELDGV